MDMINKPGHYTKHPSGIECIQITEHMNFCLGNAIKYIWRAGLKNDSIEDLKKASWYINREIKRMTDENNTDGHRDERPTGHGDEDSLHRVEGSWHHEDVLNRRARRDWYSAQGI